MRVLTLCAVALIAAASAARAQIDRRPRLVQPVVPGPRNAAFLEILGPGGLYSLNYERMTPSFMLFRVGATNGAMRNADNVLEGESAVIVTFGRELHVSLPGGEANSPIEVGGGVVAGRQWMEHGSTRDDGPYSALVGALGLRSRNSGHGYVWRLTFTPLFNFSAHNDNTTKGLQPYGGGSVGWVF